MNTKTALLLLFVLPVGGACASDEAAMDPDDPGPDPALELDPSVYRLLSRSIDNDYRDLIPLTDAIGDARYIGVGEAAHGNDGFHDMQGRLFAYAAEKLGVRVFGWESSQAFLADADRFVRTCEGDPRQIVSSWGNSAGMGVVRILEWMCSYNQEHPDDPVAIYGFDIWNGPEDYRFLKDALAGDVVEKLGSCYAVHSESTAAFYSSPFPPVSQDSHEICQEGLAAGLESTGGDIDVEIALRRLYGWDNFWVLSSSSSYEEQREGSRIRDEVMGFLTTAIADRDFSEQRIVLYGHNAHLAKRFEDIDAQAGPYSHVRMGSFLREDLGDDYFVVAITGYDVSIKILGYEGPVNLPTAEHSLERILHFDYDADFALVDLQKPPEESAFPIGESYLVGGIEMVASDQFDAVVFMDQAEAQVTP